MYIVNITIFGGISKDVSI